jgi:hypothetical protein
MDGTNPRMKPTNMPANEDKLPARVPLVPERTEFLEGESPAEDMVEAFLAKALEASSRAAPTIAGALVPWICDALLSNNSVKGYGRDLIDFVRQMQAQGIDPLLVTADHVKFYKRALLEAGRTSATVARRLSVLRGTYKQLAVKGLISWETAQDIVGDRRGRALLTCNRETEPEETKNPARRCTTSIGLCVASRDRR